MRRSAMSSVGCALASVARHSAMGLPPMAASVASTWRMSASSRSAAPERASLRLTFVGGQPAHVHR